VILKRNMSQVFNKLYEFGGFRLDPVERLLWRGEETLILPPKVFDTLLVLLEKDGRVVSKSELMEAIWGDTFVEESNMSQNIYTLRRTLGVDGQGRQFIETVPRRGYRFAVPVTLLDESANDSGAGQGAEVAAEPASPPEVLTNPVKAYDPLPSAENRPDSAALSPSTDESQAAATTEASPLPPASPSPLPPSGQTHRLSAFRIGLWAGLGVLLLLALGSGVYQLVIRRGEKQQVRIAPIEQVRFQRLTDSGDIVFPVLSPNGEFLAYVRQEEREETVWVKQIATGSAVQTLPPSRKGYRCLAFSPDGKYLFFREEAEAGGIYQTSVFGGTPKKVADNVWSDFSISPDGRQFAFVRRDNARNAHLLMLSNLDGSGEYEVSARQLPLNYRGIPTWSPDGTKIVIPAGLQQQFLPKLLTVDLASGQETELKTPRWRAISHALWMPDGKHLLVAARESNESTSQLWMLPYPDGEIRRLTNDLESYFWLSLSSDGRMLVTRQQRIVSHLWALPDGDVKKARQLTFGRRNFDGYVGLAWAPDNRIISASATTMLQTFIL
jgi:DNA-binding winged helix-turn-helix (wHTH) protein